MREYFMAIFKLERDFFQDGLQNCDPLSLNMDGGRVTIRKYAILT
jgi:hypothetical protein